MSASLCHLVRVHQPTDWSDVANADTRAMLERSSRKQVGFYAVAVLLSEDERRFFGTSLAARAVVDDFGNLVRVQ